MKLFSTVCDAQVDVVKAPSDDVEVSCGGAPMVAEDPGGASGAPDASLGDGPALGKRYADDELGLEPLIATNDLAEWVRSGADEASDGVKASAQAAATAGRTAAAGDRGEARLAGFPPATDGFLGRVAEISDIAGRLRRGEVDDNPLQPAPVEVLDRVGDPHCSLDTVTRNLPLAVSGMSSTRCRSRLASLPSTFAISRRT